MLGVGFYDCCWSAAGTFSIIWIKLLILKHEIVSYTCRNQHVTRADLTWREVSHYEYHLSLSLSVSSSSPWERSTVRRVNAAFAASTTTAPGSRTVWERGTTAGSLSTCWCSCLLCCGLFTSLCTSKHRSTCWWILAASVCPLMVTQWKEFSRGDIVSVLQVYLCNIR